MTTGTVSSDNLTSLYSNTTSFTTGVVNSAVYSVNGGTGVTVNPTTGNVVVSIGQDVATTANVQFNNLTATGNLSNNYFTLANAVGTNGQVLTSNGAGATLWTTITDINTTYNIDATATTGGANLNLNGSDLTVDSVAYKGAGGTTVTRTDANTITISSTGTGGAISLNDLTDVTLTAPLYNGQLFSYLNGQWVNDNKVTVTDSNERNVFSYRPLTPIAGPNTAVYLRKDYSDAAPGTAGIGTYTTGAGSGVTFGVVSDSQVAPGGSTAGVANNFATINGIWDSTNPYFQFRTTINGGAPTPTNVTTAQISGTVVDFKGTTLTLDAFNVGTGNNSVFAANRGSSSATDATLTWNETTDFWVFNESVFGLKEIIANTTVGTNGQYVTFNNEDLLPVGDCFLLVKRGPSDPDVMIKWNEGIDRWQNTFDGSTYYNLPNQNLDTTDDVNFSSVVLDTIATINTQTTTTTATTATAISQTTRRSQKVVINILDNVTGDFHMLEALAFQKGTTGYLTTYAEMYSNAALASFTADVSAGSIRILATPASTNSTTFTVARISLT